ncbi:ABC transporter permease [candidate division KSB1 bacterium]|nr:ABC transporter permease [candidate division KSB1 bacterium]RQW10186.1 MAG: ABC transporter permease [candidate division KSB1 bacterium]
MRRLGYLLQKEFIQIRRNKFMARAIIFVPIVQMLVLVPAVTFDIKNIDLCVVDYDLSSTSRELVNALQASTFFRVNRMTFSAKEAQELLHRDEIDVILNIPAAFERDLMVKDAATLQLLINGINGALAQTTLVYFTGVIADFHRNIAMQHVVIKPVAPAPQIHTRTRYWFNPELDYRIYMAPGILAILVTAIGFLLSGMNLVREKEIGTSEQMNVSPIKKHEFILGKMIPFMVIGVVDLAFGLALARLVYGMPFAGNILLLFGFTLIYLIAVMGLALFLSTFADTQQQYLFICFFFMMIFMLMSGIFTPAESMPDWAQKVNQLNPAAYLIRVIRMIVLKGSGLWDIRWDILRLSLLAITMTVFASLKYKKTT